MNFTRFTKLGLAHSRRTLFLRRNLVDHATPTDTISNDKCEPHEINVNEFDTSKTDEVKTFEQLFRESHFANLGELNGQEVVGQIVHRMGKDLYIDFGFKFNAVCKAPQKNVERYVIGAKVLLRLYDTELSERFLGSRRDLTLLEADADLIGLYSEKRYRKTAINSNKDLNVASNKSANSTTHVIESSS